VTDPQLIARAAAVLYAGCGVHVDRLDCGVDGPLTPHDAAHETERRAANDAPSPFEAAG
jgi:hypothetical protein